jgi:hypothetical protein
MTQDFIFAQDVILDPDTGKALAVVRNGGVWRDGVRIGVLVGQQMYDLKGNLLGEIAAGAGPLPISFKNLVQGKSRTPNAPQPHSHAPRDGGGPRAINPPRRSTKAWPRTWGPRMARSPAG